MDKLFEMMVIEQKNASIPWPKDENKESNEEEFKLKDQELGTKLSTVYYEQIRPPSR